LAKLSKCCSKMVNIKCSFKTESQHTSVGKLFYRHAQRPKMRDLQLTKLIERVQMRRVIRGYPSAADVKQQTIQLRRYRRPDFAGKECAFKRFGELLLIGTNDVVSAMTWHRCDCLYSKRLSRCYFRHATAQDWI